MSIFDTDLVTSELHVPLREQFAAELSAMIKKNRFKLLDARRTHGLDSVLNCLEMYVGQLKLRPKYESMSITGRADGIYRYRTGCARTYCTYIKGNIYISIYTGDAWAGRPCNKDEYGHITIVLDDSLRETTYRLIKFETVY